MLAEADIELDPRKGTAMNDCYVVGFLFNRSGDMVAMVQKRRPTWQAGYFNGCGGRVKPSETVQQAMVRECREEMGAQTDIADWRVIAIQHFPAGQVFYFASFNDDAFGQVRTLTDEMVRFLPVTRLADFPVVANANYLIPLAIHADAARSGSRLCLPIFLVEGAA